MCIEPLTPLYFQDPNTKVKGFMESNPLLSDFDAQIKYYQRLETKVEELPGSYHIGPVEYVTEKIKEALVTETKAWKQAFGKALAEKVDKYWVCNRNQWIIALIR